jgi:glucose/arabinose dehydrogenase
VLDGFISPVYLTHAFDDRLFVVEQAGTIQVVRAGAMGAAPFLDIQERVGDAGNEQGLLSLAFHPDYAANGHFYVNYTDNSGDTVVSRFERQASNPDLADPASETIIIAVDQPFANHNGGQLQFGPDGYLYIGMGDGGSGGDPAGHGQDQTTLLGDLLRIDINSAEPYAIPTDNPFAADSGRRGEIWGSGLRNPWRFSFDRATGDLYVADVGQGAWEEVNFQPAGVGGANYGWNIFEGTHCYRGDNCQAGGLVMPVAEYSHDHGCSVSGGYVYRGASFPVLSGIYFFGDYCSGIIWALARSEQGEWQTQQVALTGLRITSFGEDAAGELYVLDRAGGLYQIQP